MRMKWTPAALVLLGGGFFLLTGLAWGQEACPSPGGCCTPKVCVPTVGTKAVDKRVYGSLCEEFCIPKCNLLSLLRGHGSCCSCPVCEAPRMRKVLLIKIRKEERCEKKCVLQEAPCGGPACPCGPQVVPGVPGVPTLAAPPKTQVPGEPIPPPKPGK